MNKKNSGDRNSGNRNSGDSNSGYWNSGNRNSGYCNSGDWNSGNWNSGNSNSGYWNSGYWNSGNCNSGYWNSGNRNSGDRNSGNRNSGDSNSGDWNSGDSNSGNRNSGYWNSGDCNSGYCNSDKPFIRFFNKPTKLLNLSDVNIPHYFYFNLNEWVPIENMTPSEKKTYPFYKVTRGFLRTLGYKEAWLKAFQSADKKDVALTLELPNFNYKIFEEISGITKEMIVKKLGKQT